MAVVVPWLCSNDKAKGTRDTGWTSNLFLYHLKIQKDGTIKTGMKLWTVVVLLVLGALYRQVAVGQK